MIAVVGGGRCGTSLMMQTLSLLGVPLLGNPAALTTHQLWQAYQENSGKVLDDLPMSKNPKGYYEVSLNKIDGIVAGRDTNHYNGEAIKFTTPDIIDIDPEKIESVIYCRRKNIRKAAKSMALLARQDYEYGRDNNLRFCFSSIYPAFKTKDWEKHMVFFNERVTDWIEKIKKPCVEIWFEDITRNPEPIIQHLGDFLNLDNPNISEALKNVEKR